MNPFTSETRRSSLLNSLPLLLVGAVSGAMLSRADFDTAVAQERRPKPPVAFKSGGERAAQTLEKISTQLTKLDARLANIEAAVTNTKLKR